MLPLVPPDSLRAALDSVFRSPAYDWHSTDSAVSWLHARWLELMAWLTRLRDVNPLVYRAFIALLVVVLVAVILHAVWLLVRTARAAQSGASDAAADIAGPPDAAWFRAEADRLAGLGRFADAAQAEFVALAHRLDADGMLQYHPSKTPAECAREARLSMADEPRLRRLVGELYAAAFGGGPFGAEAFARWRGEALGEWRAAAH